MNFINRNDRQLYFNQVKGTISEMNSDMNFCNITLTVGHEQKREVNFVIKKQLFDQVIEKFHLGDKVNIKFYLSSKNKNGRWYTMANVLEISYDFTPVKITDSFEA